MRFLSLILVLLASDALACSCAGSDLQGQYEGSDNVFTAVVTGARFDDDGNIEADFMITEVFKGDIPFDKLRTTRSGTTCDTSITVGPEYIFFMGDEGRFGMCSGNKTIVPGRPTPWLDLLKAYKAGETPDLSSPWDFRHHDGSCSLRTDFRSTEDWIMSHLTLEYRYAAPDNPVWTIEQMNKAGYARAVFILPTRKEPADATLNLKTRDREFGATWSDDALPGRSRGAFQLSGDDVRAFAQELLHTKVVQVAGSLERYPSLDGTVIRTTNAGSAIADFVECASQ
ncbi:MAG: hypothetical protein OEQ14_11625 [Gammaproteobacteria bacterium]|nr:hypothetical protein [Gammaproteobacteria bacterium]